MRAEFVRLNDARLAIVPDRLWLESRARTYLIVLAVVLLLAVLAA